MIKLLKINSYSISLPIIVVLLLITTDFIQAQNKKVSIVFSGNNNGYFRDCG